MHYVHNHIYCYFKYIYIILYYKDIIRRVSIYYGIAGKGR